MRDLAIALDNGDHDHRLILVVDDLEKASAVADAWARGRAGG